MASAVASTPLSVPHSTRRQPQSNRGRGRSEARTARVRDLLLSRVTSLHKQATGQQPQQEALQNVSREIEALVKTGVVSDADVRRLAAGLRAPPEASTVSVAQRDDQHTGAESGVCLPPLGPKPPASLVAVSAVEGSPARRLYDRQQRDLWAQLTKRDVEQYKDEEERRQQRRKDLMLRQREVLDAQLADAAKGRAKELRREHDEEQQALLQQEQWRREAARARERQQQLIATERNQRELEHRRATQRRELAERKRREQELDEVARIRSEMEEEEKRQREKRRQVQDDIRRFMEFNQEQKARKQQRRMEEIERDKELHLQYLARLERQEQERKAALSKMYDRQQRSVAMGAIIQKGAEERLAEDERRADEEQRKALMRMTEEERRRASRTEDEKRRVRECLAQQVRDKDQRRVEERQEDARLRQRMLLEAKEEEEKERKRIQARRNAERQNRSALEDQIRRKQQEEAPMTMHEQQLNRELLRRLVHEGKR